MSTLNYLPPGSFYRAGMSATKRAADVAGASEIAMQYYRGIWRPASEDKKTYGKKVAAVGIDFQLHFMDDGALPVPGSYADSDRFTDLLYREGGKIATLALSGDQHPPLAIYFPIWWAAGRNFTDPDSKVEYKRGDHPNPYTQILEEAIGDGSWHALIDVAWSHSYPTALKANNRKPLMVWSRHCEANTAGATIVPTLYEAVMVHSFARFANPFFIWKGNLAKSEHYSPLELEVEIPGFSSLNTRFLKLIMEHDLTLVGGEALSHCVLAFMETLVRYFAANDKSVLRRIVFLTDCTSPVVHPTIDFKGMALQRLDEMRRDYGIQLAKSTEIYL